MTKPQVKQIGDYLKNLENSLNNPHFSPISLRTELPRLYETIKILMDETFRTKDKKLKTLLAYMEMRLRKCRDRIEKMLGVRN